MKKKIAFYCSGNASRVFKFYNEHSIVDYPMSFVFYDGENYDIENKLVETFGDIVFSFRNSENLIGVKLSQKVSSKILEKLTELKIDYLFCFGDKILKSPLLDNYENKIINFHPSILPSFPGLRAIDQALESSVQVLGNTAHFLDKGVDTGPIIMQSVISRTAYNEYEDVLQLQIPMIQTIWNLLNEDKISIKDNKVLIKVEKNQKTFYSI